jgi:hypothetical protein
LHTTRYKQEESVLRTYDPIFVVRDYEIFGKRKFSMVITVKSQRTVSELVIRCNGWRTLIISYALCGWRLNVVCVEHNDQIYQHIRDNGRISIGDTLSEIQVSEKFRTNGNLGILIIFLFLLIG